MNDLQHVNAVQCTRESRESTEEHVCRSLFESYYDKLLSFALLYVKYYDAAQDVVSEVFYKVFKNPKKISKIRDINFYLHKSVKNQSINYLKSRKRFVHINEQELNFEDVRVSYEDPERQFLTKELRQQIVDTITNLPPKRKLVYQLITENGLKQKEVAELMNISSRTVENHMLEATRQLRAKLTKYLDIE